MQNLNDLSGLQELNNVQQASDLGGAGKPAPSKYDKFVNIAVITLMMSVIAIFSCIVVLDDIRTKKQIQAGADAFFNSPEIQAQRAKEARRQRELAKEKRLRELHTARPIQKDDLLNQQLRAQELAAENERLERQKPQGIDYTRELAAYNAKLQEVEAESERIRMEAEAAARAKAEKAARAKAEAMAQASREQAEQLRQEQQRQYEEQKILAEENAQKLAAEKARAEEMERAARAKAAQEKAAKLKAQVEALKTKKNTLKK